MGCHGGDGQLANLVDDFLAVEGGAYGGAGGGFSSWLEVRSRLPPRRQHSLGSPRLTRDRSGRRSAVRQIVDNCAIDESALIRALHGHSLPLEQVPSGTQRDLVLRFAGLYEKRGFIVGEETRSLRLCCPNGVECWGSAGDRRRNANKGSITLPWVGPAYQPGGVLVLGMNFNEAEGIAMSFRLANWECQAFAEGKKQMDYASEGYRGTNFAYRSTRSAGLVVDFADGAAIRDRREPAALVEILNRIVRLQTVKCSPHNEAWSSPTRAMWARCPPMLIADELSVARPRHVIAFGVEVRHALTRLPTFHVRARTQRLHVGTLEIPSGEVEVYMLDHPRALAYWPASHASLKRYLRRARARARRA